MFRKDICIRLCLNLHQLHLSFWLFLKYWFNDQSSYFGIDLYVNYNFTGTIYCNLTCCKMVLVHGKIQNLGENNYFYYKTILLNYVLWDRITRFLYTTCVFIMILNCFRWIKIGKINSPLEFKKCVELCITTMYDQSKTKTTESLEISI